MVSTTFLVGLVMLLVTPGPTNTLLLVAGATGAPRLAPWLLGAEATAYLTAVTLLGFALQPVIVAVPGLALGLQLLAASYLLHAAWQMWYRPLSLAVSTTAPVTPRMIATTTLLNPKTLIIAFGLMPPTWNKSISVAVAHLGLLAVIVPRVGGLWFLAGHLGSLKASACTTHTIVPRFSAVILLGFAVLLARSALAGG